MKNTILIAWCLLQAAYCFSQLPETDIWMLDIKDSSGVISFSNPQNITNRKGYDNQPLFSPDGKYILFSSQRDADGSTDIYKYDLKTKVTSQITKTTTSEYSPAWVPAEKSSLSGGSQVSVVMVEKDSIQRLWKFPLAGGAPTCIMKNIDSVGYYCWINKDSMAVFVLTKPSFTLQIMNVNSQQPKIIADSIGRCIKMKDGNLWYTTITGHFNTVYEYSFKSKTAVMKGMIESEDYCFYGKNGIWSFSENTIVRGYMNNKEGADEIVNLESFGITKPARIALSPDGKKLAVVSTK